MTRVLLALVLLLCFSPVLATESPQTVIFQSNFEDGFDGWNSIGLDWSIVEPGFGNYGQAARVTYAYRGSESYWLEKDLSRDNLNEATVEFDFKVTYGAGELPYGGCKFMKLFGIPYSPEGFANITFGMNYYDRNELKEVSYGGGSTLLLRDSQSTIRYNGTQVNTYEPKPVIISYSYAIDDHLDQNWHQFRAYARYNDNDQANGEYKVWIDGILRLHAMGVTNRHNNNSPYFWKAHFGGYNGSTSSSFPPWHLTIDNVKITKPAPAEPVPPGKMKTPKSNGGKK
jgi:hypothetical protein